MAVSAPERPRRAPAVLCGLCAGLATVLVVAAPAPAAAAGEDGEARMLLETAVAALDQPHVGRVSVVTFSEAGPRVAELVVRVGALGELELRRPTRWLLDAPGSGWMRTASGSQEAVPAAPGVWLDVDAVLAGWEATVGEPTRLDTGPATPVHLVRRRGAAVEEVVHVDLATGLPVRRETRGTDGEVLRIVAYTSLSQVSVAAPGAVATSAPTGPTQRAADVDGLLDDGYLVPGRLGAGFELVGVARHDDMAVTRYSDGLSVLSLYQQHGRLDPGSLDGATVRTVAGRDVWAWPGSEPLRLVWTSDAHTWTVVSDAPLEVIEDALVVLPGDHVGHDVPSRIARGMSRAWQGLRGVAG